MTVLTRTKGFCVLVRLLPKVTYHASEELLSFSEATQNALRQKTELVTALTLAMLMGTSSYTVNCQCFSTVYIYSVNCIFPCCLIQLKKNVIVILVLMDNTLTTLGN